MNSRDNILQRLRAASSPFPAAHPPDNRLAVAQLTAEDREVLVARFTEEAQKLECKVHTVEDVSAVPKVVLNILEGEKTVLAWDFDQIPCPQLESALHEARIAVAPTNDPHARIGITGAEAAIAATGSLVIVSGPGRSRVTALLPQTHIVVITQDQILPNVESWLSKQRTNDLAAFQQAANINIISGPSRTADIAMELILGMHGPASVQIIIIENS